MTNDALEFVSIEQININSQLYFFYIHFIDYYFFQIIFKIIMSSHSLEVTVGSTSSLKENRANNKQDPFAVIRLGEMVHRTDEDAKSGRSVWNHRFYFPLPPISDAPKVLELEIWHKKESIDKLLGTCKVKLDQVYSDGAQDAFQTVLRQSGKLLGRIRLHLNLVHREEPEKSKTHVKFHHQSKNSTVDGDTSSPKDGIIPNIIVTSSGVSSSDFSDTSEESWSKKRSPNLEMFLDSDSDVFSPSGASDLGDDSSTFWKNLLVRNHQEELRKRLERDSEVQTFKQFNPFQNTDPLDNKSLNLTLPSNEETLNARSQLLAEQRFREYTSFVPETGSKMEERNLNDGWTGASSLLMNPIPVPSSTPSSAYLPAFSKAITTSLPQFLSSSDSLESTDSKVIPPFLLPERGFSRTGLEPNLMPGLERTELNLNPGTFRRIPPTIQPPPSQPMVSKTNNFTPLPILLNPQLNHDPLDVEKISALFRTNPGLEVETMGLLSRSEPSMFYEGRGLEEVFKMQGYHDKRPGGNFEMRNFMGNLGNSNVGLRSPNLTSTIGLEGFVSLQNFQPSFDGMVFDSEVGLGANASSIETTASFRPDTSEENLLTVLGHMRYANFGSANAAMSRSGC